jgi:predicted RNA binding protein with dsRBD fold (UPF0201 family)
MDKIAVYVETEINLTEDEEKVRKAVANIFDDISMEINPSYRGSMLSAEAKGQAALVKLRNVLRSDRIRDAARKVFLRGIRGNAVSFCLNKQVAFAGHVSFSEEVAESPLGPIKVTIKCDDPRLIIDWLVLRTD